MVVRAVRGADSSHRATTTCVNVCASVQAPYLPWATTFIHSARSAGPAEVCVATTSDGWVDVDCLDTRDFLCEFTAPRVMTVASADQL